MTFTNSQKARPIYSTRAHRRQRQAAIAAFTPGDPCTICGHPMHPRPDGRTDWLHLNHDWTDPTGNTYTGLAHGYPCPDCGHRCNQRDGALNAIAGIQPGDPRPTTNPSSTPPELPEEDARWML